jgi:small multidrug resistance pump
MNNIYIFLFILSILIASFSQILLKTGAKEKNIYLNKYTIIGYIIMFGSTICTLIAYKNVNLSLGQILQSLSFVFVTILSYFILKEKISEKKLLGLVIIIIGIIIFNI